MRCKLGNIIKINQYTYTSHDQWKYVNYLDTGNITKNVIDTVQYINLSKEVLPSRARRKVKKNSILYSMVRPNQSHYGIVKDNIDNFLVSTGFAVIDVDTNKICPAFIYYMLTQQKMTEHLQTIAEQSVSAYPSIKPSDIENLDIILPGLLQQQKIAKLLGALDDKIELNRQINTNLEQQAQAIFKSWFIDFEPFGGTMPDDWRITTLNQISKLNAGGDKPLKISNIKTKQYLYPVYSNGLANDGLYGYTDNAKIFNESVTVSARGTIGSICLRHTPFVPIVRLISIIPNSFITAKYLYCWLKHSHITGTGTTQQQLTIPDFGKKEIIVPPIDLMYYFTETVEPLFNNIWLIQDEIYTLTTIRDTLLPKLMSGEIDVSKIELD